MAGWRPRRADTSVPRPLQDGTPPHIEQALRPWVEDHLTYPVLREWDLVSEREPILPVVSQLGFDDVWGFMPPDDRLDLIDWLLYRDASDPRSDPLAVPRLAKILEDGSSLWRVGTRDGHPGLLRRVPEGVQRAAEEAMSTPGDAGALLSEAWASLYGRPEDLADAYDKAVKAVEAASTPVVKPTDRTASLSKVIGQMRADGNWTITLDKEHPQNPLDKVLLDMMQALMSGHSDRHPGTPGYTPTSREAATAAVGLAVTLVQWFASGVVVRRPPA